MTTKPSLRVRDLMQAAKAVIPELSAKEAIVLRQDPDVVFLDVRDRAELVEVGALPASVHVSRGKLEFVVDAESPAHHSIFDQDKHFIVYCAVGARSLLAAKTLSDMGVQRVSSLAGGISAWLEEAGPIVKED